MPKYDKEIEKAEIVIKKLEEMARTETNTARKYAILAARDHFLFACAALRHDQTDRAGRHLEAARTIIKQEVMA